MVTRAMQRGGAFGPVSFDDNRVSGHFEDLVITCYLHLGMALTLGIVVALRW